MEYYLLLWGLTGALITLVMWYREYQYSVETFTYLYPKPYSFKRYVIQNSAHILFILPLQTILGPLSLIVWLFAERFIWHD